jgi:hypothetical protein
MGESTTGFKRSLLSQFTLMSNVETRPHDFLILLILSELIDENGLLNFRHFPVPARMTWSSGWLGGRVLWRVVHSERPMSNMHVLRSATE